MALRLAPVLARGTADRFGVTAACVIGALAVVADREDICDTGLAAIQSAVPGDVMLIILTLYVVLAWLVFSKLKLVRWGWISGTIAVSAAR